MDISELINKKRKQIRYEKLDTVNAQISTFCIS